MKIISLTLLLTTIILFACNDQKKNKVAEVPKKTYRDTTWPVALYLGYGLKGLEYDVIQKITVYDTAVWELNADTTSAKKIIKDTFFYEVPVWIPIKDEQMAKAVGVTSTDTMVRRRLPSLPKYVREFPMFDSVVKQLNLLRDTTKPKIDTAKK